MVEGDTFSVSPDSGFLIVFYNNGQENGSLNFEYWVEATKKKSFCLSTILVLDSCPSSKKTNCVFEIKHIGDDKKGKTPNE